MKCPYCKVEFEGKFYKVKGDSGQFCSIDCANEAYDEIQAKFADFEPAINEVDNV